jgi:hypothetical protein
LQHYLAAHNLAAGLQRYLAISFLNKQHEH